MKKIRSNEKTGIKVWNHIKENKASYIIGLVAAYVGYHIIKMLSDKGLDKEGKPYYENFDDPVDDLENKEGE